MFPMWAYALSLGISVVFLASLIYIVWALVPSPKTKEEREELKELEEEEEEEDTQGDRQVLSLSLSLLSIRLNIYSCNSILFFFPSSLDLTYLIRVHSRLGVCEGECRID